MIITITGDLGSGKSTVAKQLSKKNGFDYISTGMLYRKIADEYKVNALELNKISTQDTSIDDRIDGYIKSLNDTIANIVIDSRLAWHFIEKSLKIYFEVCPNIAAKRVFNDNSRVNEPNYKDVQAAYEALKERKIVENSRYLIRYGVDCDNIDNFDIVVNTSLNSIEDINSIILHIIILYTNNKYMPKYWVNPKMLYPTEDIRLLAREKTHSIYESMNENKYDSNFPIQCVKVDGKYYIWDGHKRCSSALYNKIGFVPVDLLATDKQEIYPGHSATEFVSKNINISRYYDWEDAHHFNFLSYPE